MTNKKKTGNVKCPGCEKIHKSNEDEIHECECNVVFIAKAKWVPNEKKLRTKSRSTL